MQKNKSHSDKILLLIVTVFVVWGTFTVGTVSFPFSLQDFGNPWHYFFSHLSKLVIGLVLAVIAFKFPLTKLKKIAPFLFLFCLLLCICVFVPGLGMRSGGALRWLRLGGFSIQPAEFLKIGFVVYLAALLSERVHLKKGQKKNQMLVPFLVVLAVLVLVLLKQPNMSTLMIIGLVGLVMYFLSSPPWWHIASLIGVGAGAAALAIKMAPYRVARFLTFLNPQSDPMGRGYQLKQAAIAIGSGGIFGIGSGFGLGLSRQKFGFLPEVMTDSVFAIIGEELGFVGACFLVFLFLSFAWRGLKISIGREKSFEGFLALGITIWIALQAFFNIGGIVGIVPLGGIPLPFFSYGGSHIIVELAAIGLLLNISRTAKL